jgi:hypothetical protein
VVFAKILIAISGVDCAAGWCGSIFNAESTNGDAVEYHEVDSEFLAGVDKNGWSFTFVVEREFGNDGSFVRLRDAATLGRADLIPAQAHQKLDIRFDRVR